MANPAALPTESQQPLSIRRLSTTRLEKLITSSEQKRLARQTAQQRLAFVCQRVMHLVNAKLQEKAPTTHAADGELKGLFEKVVEKSGVGKGFNFLCYVRQINSLSKFAQALVQMGGETSGLQTSRIETICFLFRVHDYFVGTKEEEEREDVYALTTSDAWRKVAHLTDYEFPHAVLMRLLETKVHGVAYQPLVGNALRGEKDFKEAEELPMTRYFDKFVTHLTSRIRPQASLYRLDAFCNKGGKVPKNASQVNVEMGSIRFKTNLALADYPPLLDHLSKIHHGEKTYAVRVNSKHKILDKNGVEEEDREALAFWKHLKPVDPEEAAGLEELFDQALWRAFSEDITLPLFFVHRLVKDYTTATSFRLVSRVIPKKLQAQCQWDSPKSAQEILSLLKDVIPSEKRENAEEFAKVLKEIKIEFKTPRKTETCSLRKMFGGEIRITESQQSYFRVGGMWLALAPDYLTWVRAEFRKLLGDCLIREGDERNLAHAWPSEKEIEKAKEKNKKAYAENIYNCSYAMIPQFLVGDRILIEKIELFDLLRLISKGVSNEILLYHVKKTFGQQTRDVVSQIRVSVALLHALLSDMASQATKLDALCDKLEKEYPGCLQKVGGKQVLLKAFERKNITYVYGLYDDSSERTLADELSRKGNLTVDDFAHFSIKSKKSKQLIPPKEVMEALEQEAYVDEEGKLQSKFSTKAEFRDEMSGHLDCTKVDAERLYDHICELVKPPYDSLIARIELLKLRSQVEKKGFKFKICLIPRPKDAKAAKADNSSGGTTLKSPSIPKSKKRPTLVEESIFTYEDQQLQIDKTVGDCTCGLHAAFGSASEQGFCFLGGAKAARNEFADELAREFDAENGKIIEAYRDLILSLCIGKGAERINGKAFALKLGVPAAKYKKRAQQLEEKREQAKDKLEKSFLKTHEKMEASKARNYNELKQILGKVKDEEALKKVFHEKRGELQTFFCAKDFPKAYIAPAEHFAELKALDEQLEALKIEIYNDQEVYEAYIACIKDTSYWFETDELCLAALAKKKSIRIFTQTKNGDVEIANEVLLERSKNIRFVFHRGVHFMHCTPVSEAPVP